MRENVGRIDRVARAIIGPALTAIGYTRLGGAEGRLAGLAAMFVGTALVDSAITRVCPLNGLLRIDTRSQRERERDLRRHLQAHGMRISEAAVVSAERVGTTWSSATGPW